MNGKSGCLALPAVVPGAAARKKQQQKTAALLASHIFMQNKLIPYLKQQMPGTDCNVCQAAHELRIPSTRYRATLCIWQGRPPILVLRPAKLGALDETVPFPRPHYRTDGFLSLIADLLVESNSIQTPPLPIATVSTIPPIASASAWTANHFKTRREARDAIICDDVVTGDPGRTSTRRLRHTQPHTHTDHRSYARPCEETAGEAVPLPSKP